MADENNDQAVESEPTPETEVELDLEASPEAAPEEGEYDENGELIETPEPVEDDSEEVEVEGQKYKIPKALKPAILMQADYTRKTQEVAEQRRALDTERASVVERLQAANQLSEEVLTAKATVIAVDHQIASLEAQAAQWADVNWDEWDETDPAASNKAWRNYQRLNETIAKAKEIKAEAAAKATQTADKLETELTEAEKAERQRHLETNWATLERDIPGWSQQKLVEVMTHANTAYGLTPQELSSITDARIIKALHRLHEVDKEAAKTAAVDKTRKTTTQIQQQQAVKPAVVVGGRQAPTKPATTSTASDRLSTEDWMKQEAERLRRKRAGG